MAISRVVNAIVQPLSLVVGQIPHGLQETKPPESNGHKGQRPRRYGRLK